MRYFSLSAPMIFSEMKADYLCWYNEYSIVADIIYIYPCCTPALTTVSLLIFELLSLMFLIDIISQKSAAALIEYCAPPKMPWSNEIIIITISAISMPAHSHLCAPPPSLPQFRATPSYIMSKSFERQPWAHWVEASEFHAQNRRVTSALSREKNNSLRRASATFIIVALARKPRFHMLPPV